MYCHDFDSSDEADVEAEAPVSPETGLGDGRTAEGGGAPVPPWTGADGVNAPGAALRDRGDHILF